MTSRFGKTYSRKGGDGGSRFDEVLSNKKTMSTKWGETTYKATLTSKRPGIRADTTALSKRSKLADEDGQEDPFGFDSDEESKPVTSRNVSQSKAPLPKPAHSGTSRVERLSLTLEPNSRVCQPASVEAVAPSRAPSVPGRERSTVRIPEDTSRFFNSSSSTGQTQSWSSEGTDRHSYSWYRNASESDGKPLAQTTALRSGATEVKDSFDSWSTIVGLRSTSPLPEPRDPFSWAISGYKRTGQDKPSPEIVEEKETSERVNQGEAQVPMETSESEDHSQSVLRASSCRTYCRPGKGKQVTGSDNATVEVMGSGNPGEAQNTKTSSRGRTRDYTVLHPSSLSACNVTIQDSLDRSMEEFTPSSTAADPSEAGWQRKKMEPVLEKPASWTRPILSKSKMDTKLDLFGFEEHKDQGEDIDSPSGSSSYKIKYFGFDDMSDSDGEEATEMRKVRRKAMLAAGVVEAVTTSLGTAESLAFGADSPPALMCTHKHTHALKHLNHECPLPYLLFHHSPCFKEVVIRMLPVVILFFCCDLDIIIFFLSVTQSPTKAVYNARHWNRPESEELPLPPPSQPTQSGSSKDTNSHKDDGVFKAPPPPPKVIKSVTIPTEPYQDIVTALKCRKEHKELYTVVRHVKHFNDVVEFGENQEFTDDFEYLATGLKTGQPLNTRCLSVISLASRCAMPGFRMHLRARGKVAQVFKTISDAPQHPNLALCTASLMYILSRDRLNMDLDRASLDLMIRLLELDQDNAASAQLTAKEMSKVKEKIRKLCETVHNKHLDLENITTGHLAMETLLSLTSKRAGDWFKEELRLLGGLDHIVDKVKECVANLNQEDDREKLVASLWGAERCLRVLESVTVQNPENQAYLIAYKDSELIVSSAKALRHCEDMIQRYSRELNVSPGGNVSVAKAVEDCMRAIIGLLLNLTHDNEWGSTKAGEQDELIVTALNCVLRVPQYIPQEQRFDIRVLGLGLLINLVEYSARNRHCLVEMEMDFSLCLGEKTEIKSEGPLSAIAVLVQLFLQREHAAMLAEAETDGLISDAPKGQLDQSGEWQETGGEIQWVASENHTEDKENKKEEEEEELDLNKALQHAGKHMEDSIVASYTALLLGCLCQGSPANVTTVRENLPKGDFSIMTEMLKKFLNFMNLTYDLGTTGQKPISRVIDYLEHC
uniref:Wings apart-like protein homolog n=1 Tax=Denticeps clupeoides TaxID=299321 RepID=A0AAY4DMW9_9TELE